MRIRSIQSRQTWIGALALLGVVLSAAACSRQSARSADPRAASHSLDRQAEYRSAARRVLGAESQVILSGDLAHNGHIQLLIVNRLTPKPVDASRPMTVSRAAVLEKDSQEWREIFLADDHLKNENGFLLGTPQGSVSGWRLQCNPGKNGLVMFFTPLNQPAGSNAATIEVRWNPARQRYQTFDRQSDNFLAEAPIPGGFPPFVIKR